MINFRIERGWSFDGYQMWVLDYRNNQGFVAKPFELEFVPMNNEWQLPEPTFRASGPMARELIAEMKKGLAGIMPWDSKEDYETSKRIEKAMQAHIDSLKLVVDRVVKP